MDKESKKVSLLITLFVTAIFVGALIYPDSDTHWKFIQKLLMLAAVSLIVTSIYATLKALNQSSKSLQTLEKIESNQNKIIFLLKKNIETKQ